MILKDFLILVTTELEAAQQNYPPMVTPHDAMGIIGEEFEELAEAVRRGTHSQVKHEAIQLAAMIARFAVDLDFAAARQNKRLVSSDGGRH